MAAEKTTDDAFLTVAATAAVATLIAQHIAGKATRDALFLTHFAVERLPLMMMVSAVISVAGVLLMSRLLARFGPARLIPIVFGVSSGLLLLQWELIDTKPRIAAAILYVQISAVNSLLISGFWSVINERFDPHSAKRVIARLSAAATFGGLAGGVASKVVSAAADVHAVLLMLAAMHVFCGIVVTWIGRGNPGDGQAPQRISLFSPLRSSSLIRTMAILALLVATLAALLDYVLKAEAARALDAEQLIGFFSYFYVAVGLGSFVLQSAVGNKALRWLGLGGTMLAWPIVILVTGTATLLFRSLLTAALMRGSANLLYNSFFRTGFEVLYTPIPAEQKRTGKVMIDVGADRAGDLLGGLIVMGILLLPAFSESVLLVTGLGMALICCVLVLVLQRNYSRQLADNLRSGQIDADEVEAVDATTSRTLAETQLAMNRASLLQEIEAHRQSATTETDREDVGEPVTRSGEHAPRIADPVLESIADLRSNDPSRIRRALASREMSSELVPHALLLLRDEEYVTDVIRALRPCATRSAGALVDALLEPLQSARVRRRIPIILGYSQAAAAVLGLTIALSDRDWNVRFRAAQGLHGIRRRDPNATIDADRLRRSIDVEIEALEQKSRSGPSQDRRLELVFLLIGIGDNPATVDLCWRALHGDDAWLKGTAVEYLENLLPPELWHRLARHLEQEPTPRPGKATSDKDPAMELQSAAEKLLKIRPGSGHKTTDTTSGGVDGGGKPQADIPE